jgi:hypothetical protein
VREQRAEKSEERNVLPLNRLYKVKMVLCANYFLTLYINEDIIFHADLIARPVGVHVLRPKQQNKSWYIIKNKFINEGFVVLQKK